MKALKNIGRIQVRPETLMLLLDLYESKGRTFYYDQLFEKDLKAFSTTTLAEDIYNIVKILDLNLTNARVSFCSKNNFTPKNKDEQLLLNIKKILEKLQQDYTRFELIVNEVHELAKLLSNNHTLINWNKTRTNEEGLLSANKFKSTREELEELNKELLNLIKQNKTERIILITNYYIDFINMKIFDNFNDEISVLLVYIMVFRAFPVFNYISFFKYFNKHLEGWKLAVQQASYNWNSSYSQTDNLNEILYQIIIDSYEEVNEVARQYEFERNLNKSDNIENSILKFTKLFSKNDLRKLHPTVSDSTIDRTLQRLKDEGKIMTIGAGRSSKWQVLVENSDFQLLDIFDKF